MIRRTAEIADLRRLLSHFKVVALLGARQVGKTTLARAVANAFAAQIHHFDLENPNDLARLSEPMLALGKLKGLVVLDEVQRVPELFPVLRVLADRPRGARFLLLGSAAPGLLKQGSETLAGRIAFHNLYGLSLQEVGANRLDPLWLRGGFPRAFTAPTLSSSWEWRQAFIQTFLERDLAQLIPALPAVAMRRLWSMLAHWHGQIVNWSELGRSLGQSDQTIRRHADILVDTFMIRQLQPWHENLNKRQVKAPKLFVADSGLLHSFLGIRTQRDLEGHPKVGASWEGFILEQLIRHLGLAPHECYFWATHGGAELDLFVLRGRRRLGFEIKRTAAPNMTPSMHSALSDLKLEELTVIHGGDHSFPLAEKVRAVAASRLLQDIEAP